MSEVVRFALIGTGWRGEFFLKVAAALPERFQCVGVRTRSAEKAADIRARWGVEVFADIADMVEKTKPEFVVVAVSKGAAPEVIVETNRLGVPILAETILIKDIEKQREFFAACGADAKIQVAEQYHLQPMQQARRAISASGLIGRVFEAQISTAQNYHGISLIRKHTGVSFEDCTVMGTRFACSIVRGPGRDALPDDEDIVDDEQTIAWFDFGDKLGVFDNTKQQIRSWIHSQRTLILGERGEIKDDKLLYLAGLRQPVEDVLTRQDIGHGEDLEGMGLRGITAAGRYWYMNPFYGPRLFDDQLAVAETLRAMGEYVRGQAGRGFYPLAQGMQDQYLSVLLEQAIAQGGKVRSQRQPWAYEE